MSYKCNRCDSEFDYHYELIIHRNTHIAKFTGKSDVFKCELCDLLCLSFDHLKQHVNNHVESKYQFFSYSSHISMNN